MSYLTTFLNFCEKKSLVMSQNKNFGWSPLSKRPKSRHRHDFVDYSVSASESYSLSASPMRKVPSCEKKILTNVRIKEPRKSYLQSRYTHLPNEKYFFPAATSWRYGWHVK